MPPVASDLIDTFDELLKTGVAGITSKRALAKRLAALDDRQSFESWKRTVNRYWSREVRPERETVALIMRAFELPEGRIPLPAKPTLASVLGRLEAHEARAELSRTAAVVSLESIDRRLSRIETQLGIPAEPAQEHSQ